MLAGGGDESGVGSDCALTSEEALMLQILKPQLSGKNYRESKITAADRTVVPGDVEWRRVQARGATR